MSIDVNGIKEGQKAMWTAGDFAEVARRITAVGEYLAQTAGAAPGVELLDVATGTGNVSVPAARAGAKVTGLDLTPKLLADQARRAAAEGVEIQLVEGDAEELPFGEGSFDSVTSCFGVMFAPRHRVAAAELVRVARPGGRIVVAAWTPDGMVGRMFRTSASYMPPPPEGFDPPVMWGVEDHVRGLFADTGAELSFEPRTVAFEGESVEAWVARDEKNLGPAVMAKAALEHQGRYDELRRDVIDLYEEFNEATDGSFRGSAEYLVTVAELPG
ncbi:MAG TPA: class I SAM-dependent methyltransferase [Solirubrobacteraceae bacterium]|jgi:ubiquinone/menaquinone biosynthesis C-methylase UbiE|nr:class I SAM-dependent methyltransferase [Solirubrobacteraceae bacterium]